MIIRESIDPLSEAGIANEGTVIMAHAESMRVLRDELARYCRRQIQGRSFLIAGHRGAGKTFLVADAIRENMATDPQKGVLRPLPVFLHGPSLLHTLPSDLRRDEFSLADHDSARTRTPGPAEQSAGHPAAVSRSRSPLQVGHPGGRSPPARSAGRGADGIADDQAGGDSPDFTEAQERRVQQGLVHVILSLHRAVVREYSRHYREAVLERGRSAPEARELAARFEIELLEDPRASRLREFWELAGALDDGILIKAPEARAEDQGMRELVALNGMCNAHQRISGALSQKETDNAENKKEPVKGGLDAKAVDSLKPLGAVLAGGLVAGGGAIGSNELLVPSLFGIFIAWAATRFLQSTSTATETRTRITDQTFIPDLTPRTLDRILPTLLDRLRNAGLAPVLIIDELDKVSDLPNRIERLVSYLKKLVAENVFSCFLTDRSYFEYLRAGERSGGTYSRTSSYFTHRMMVAYGPRDIDAYLAELIKVPAVGSPASIAPAGDDPEEIDRTVLRWVLRHRSRLHGLDLQREIAALRGPDNVVNIPEGAIRSDYQYLIDLTLQVAIELTLYSKEVHAWCQRQPALQAVLYDALYHPSRSWLRGDEKIDVTPAGTQAIIEELVERMNLAELDRATGEMGGKQPLPLAPDDASMLRNVVAQVASLLSEETTREAVEAQWNETVDRMRWGMESRMRQEVLVALLVGKQSLLVSPAIAVTVPTSTTAKFQGAIYRWRYWRSGTPRPGLEPEFFTLDSQKKEELPETLEFLRTCSANIGEELSDSDDPTTQDGFALLGDVFRVIRTTPAWSQVKRAMSNLDQVLVGSGDLMSAERDLRTVEDFGKVLSEGAPAVAMLLFSSAFVGSLASTKERQLGIRACAALISTGLGFAHLKPEDVLLRMSEFLEELKARHKELAHALAPMANSPDPDICGDSFRSVISDCTTAGEKSAFDWTRITNDAWDELAKRMKQREESDRHVPATMAEILCAARGVGPGLFLSLDLGRTTLAEWTRVLLRSLNVRQKYPPEEYVPVTLSVHALFQLGGRNLPREQVDRIIRAGHIQSIDVNILLSVMRRQRSSVAAPSRAAIVIRRSRESLTGDWRPEPGLGVVFVLDAADDLETAFKLAREVNPQRPVRVVLEEPAGDPAEVAGLLSKLGSPAQDQYQVVYMSPNAFTADMRTPVIVDPSGPDAVFRRPRESRTASSRP